jgi:hypothetical protein
MKIKKIKIKNQEEHQLNEKPKRKPGRTRKKLDKKTKNQL